MRQLDQRNLIGLALLVLSVVLLIPGLINDLLTIKISFALPLFGSQEVHNETRSILGTIGELFANGNGIVAFLILFFSVIVPIVKALILFAALLIPNLRSGDRLHRFVGIISKWSMADVFVVGVFIAFLSMKSNDQIFSEVHGGFYFFAAYCIVSILAAQLIRIHSPASAEA